MSLQKKQPPMIWMDMEMTGLDPEKERIIEVAVIITDSELNIIEEGPNLVVHQPNKLLKGMDEWNQKHHKKSGLIDAVKNSTLTLKAAEKQILAFIKKHVPEKKSPLCGNSIHHDRLFLRKYMPSVDKYIHYRLIDVSTLKGLIQRWYPKIKSHGKDNAHRALSDIQESIEELRFYRQHYFKKNVVSKKK